MSESSAIPPAQIPPSKAIVKVSMIDTLTVIDGMKTSLLFKDPIPGFDAIHDMPVWAFVIEHEASGLKILFDAGTRLDWQERPPAVRDEVDGNGYSAKVQKDMKQILSDHNLKTSDIAGVIWSHYHWDHVGDMTTFPKTVPLVVGPGFKDEFFPGWPAEKNSPLDSAAWTDGRELIELDNITAGFHGDHPSATTLVSETLINTPKTLQDFLSMAQAVTICSLPALDVFSDGSLYILSTPGHAPAHLSLLARTAPDPISEFVLLAADAFDNAGQIRPSRYMLLPESIIARLQQNGTHGKRLLARTKSEHDQVQPFMRPETDAEDYLKAVRSLASLSGIDAREDVLTLCAHERYHTLKFDGRTGIEMMPAYLNGWRQKKDQHGKNLRDRLLWWFLKDYGIGCVDRDDGAENHASN